MKGILNIGNTCSISALLQCLFHSPHILQYMLNQPVGCMFRELICAYHSDDRVSCVSPALLMKDMSQEWTVGVQLDVCEAWLQLLERLGKSLHSQQHLRAYRLHAHSFIHRTGCPPEYSAFVMRAADITTNINRETASAWTDMFQGMYVFQTQCGVCGHMTHTFEPFSMISLDITSTQLTGCLEQTMRTDVIEGWECDRCKIRSEVRRHVRFWNIPNVLCISLKRFTHDGQKNHENVDIPYTFGITRESIIGPTQIMGEYTLRGIAVHHGNIYGGHYTALVQENGEWWHADDSTIQRMEHIPRSLMSQAYFIVYDLTPSSS